VECESKSDTGNNKGQLEPFKNHSDNTRATYWESRKLRNCKKTVILGTAHILRQVLM